jgi:glycosyltransferase involved in cell wall biosynthesis
MILGLDLSSLQGGHRMRGVGYTLINFINGLSPELRQEHNFVFYYYKGDEFDDPLPLLNLENIKYEIRPIEPTNRLKKTLPWRLNIIIRALNKAIELRNIYSGDPRIKDVSGIDAFLQTDPSVSLPKGQKIKKVFIAYDVIPYVLEWDYLWNYRTARLHGLPLRSAIICQSRRWLYIQKLRVNSRRADHIISISDATKHDFRKYVRTPKNKISTIPLGINKDFDADRPAPEMHHFISSSWGYLKRPYSFDDTPFFLFVGGADDRRRLDDLVTAFNHLRAKGRKIKLVFAGDIMQGPLNIPTLRIQKALAETSYLDDIVFMGFVDDAQRDWLYQNAQAFVFPSNYEGFGLPVLEAFGYGCPVIAYKNSATFEIAKNIPVYCKGALELASAMEKLLNTSGQELEDLKQRGREQVENYSWSATAANIMKLIG